jgi:3-hydroxybutyryl-CoA dehydrogenase
MTHADNINRLAVVGTGQMGPGIAAVAALAGTDVTLIARSEAAADRGRAHFASDLAFLLDNGLAESADVDAAAARLSVSLDLAAAAACDMVIESIVEQLPTKQAFFAALDDLCPPRVILASNTSGLRISDISAQMHRPERAVTMHFWNPAHLIPLVEVIQGERTAEETVQTAWRFLQRCGKRPVIGRKDVLGQIGNRLQQAVMREAIYMVQEGIASAEDIETALKAGPGLRWPVYGPLEHLDVVGLDMGLAIQDAVLPGLCNEGEPGRLLVELVQAGHLGVRTGQGFYDWRERSADELIRQRNAFVVARVKEARGRTEA